MTQDLQHIIDLCQNQPELAFKLSEELLEKSILLKDDFKAMESKMMMAHAAQFLGQYAMSFQLANDCLSYFEKKKADFHVGYVLNTFGFIYNYFDDHKSRLEVNLKSLKLRKKTGDIDGYTRSLNNIGDTYIRLEQFQKAIPYLKECLTNTPSENIRMLCVANSNLGEAYFYLDDFKSSIEHFNACLYKSNSIHFHSLIFNSQLFLGMIELKSKDFLKAKGYFDEASKTLNFLNNATSEQALLHKQFGNYYEQINDYKQAIVHFKEFYLLEEKIKTEKQQKEIKSIQQSVEIKELKTQKISLEAKIEDRTHKLRSTLEVLRAQELLNSKILNSAKNAIVVFDENGKIHDFNPSAQKLLKIKKNHFIHNYLKFKDDNIFDQVLKHLFSPQASDHLKFEFEMSHLNETTELTLDVAFTHIKEEKKQKGICFINDITIQVQAENERKKELETEITINFFAQSLFNSNSLDDVIWGLAKNCIAKLDFVDCIIYLLDEETNELVQSAAYGPKNPIDFDIHNPIKIPLGQGIVGSVAKTGIAEIVSDTSCDERYIIDDDMRLSEIAVPIKLGEKVIGVIDSEHPKKNFYSSKHLRILTTISKLVANRIDKLKEQQLKENLQNEIIKINENLEQQVIEKTKENIQLNKEIAEKEKSILMAEMSSLLSHELNTPLANIKNSSSALIETINNHSSIHNLKNGKLNFANEKLIQLLKSSISEPIKLNSTKELLSAQKTVSNFIQNNGLLNLKNSIADIVKLNLQDEEILITLNSINEVENTLKLAVYEKSISTYIHIMKSGVKDISRVVEEVKSLKSLEGINRNDEIQLYDVIKTNLKQTFKDISSSQNEQLISISGDIIKITQLWNGIWKIVEEFSTLDQSKNPKFNVLKNHNHTILQIELPTLFIDEIFFNESTDFNSYAGVNHSLKIRLSVIKSILEEHNAKLNFKIIDEYLIFIIEFSTKDKKY